MAIPAPRIGDGFGLGPSPAERTVPVPVALPWPNISGCHDWGDGDSCMTELVRSMRLDRVPAAYRDLVEPVRDPQLLAAYLQWMVTSSPDDVTSDIARMRRLTGTVHLEILGEEPWQGYSEWAQRLAPTLRREVYSVPGQFPHLVDVLRFAADLRKLL